MFRWFFRLAVAAVLSGMWSVPAHAQDITPFPDSPAAIFVTGYTCPPYCAPTADGTPVGRGSAACPPWWPFGTQVDIEDVGSVTCDDLYDSSLSKRIDVFEPDENSCYAITGWHEYSATLEDGTAMPPNLA